MTINSRTPACSRYTLALPLAVNLLNCIDRQILSAVFPLIKADFRLSDTALGFLGSTFMVENLWMNKTRCSDCRSTTSMDR